MGSEQFYTAQEAADLYGVAESTIRKYIRNGRLSASKHGKTWHIAASALRETFSESPDTPYDKPHSVAHGIPYAVQHTAHKERVQSLEAEFDDVRRENEKLKTDMERQIERANLEAQHLADSLEEKVLENQQLREQLSRSHEQIDALNRTIESLTQSLDQEQHLNALAQKNLATVTEQLSSSQQQLEDMRRWQQMSWWKRLFSTKKPH